METTSHGRTGRFERCTVAKPWTGTHSQHRTLQYDTKGEGLIITNHSKLQYYPSLTNWQLPVELQLIKFLADHLNAEVVLQSIQSLEEGVD